MKAKYVKASGLLKDALGLCNRQQFPDGNWLLLAEDLYRPPCNENIFTWRENLHKYGALALTAEEVKAELAGGTAKPMPVATEERWVVALDTPDTSEEPTEDKDEQPIPDDEENEITEEEKGGDE